MTTESAATSSPDEVEPTPAGLEIPIGIGDDAAHLRIRGRGDLIVTTDALIEDVHFRRCWISDKDLGAKSLTVSLSDLAAMGAKPVAGFLCLGVPPETAIADLKSFFSGLRGQGRRFACPLVGGDLVRAKQWTINLTLLGRPSLGS